MKKNSAYCSKSWTDINIDFENRTLRHCCKTVPYDFPENLTKEFISNSELIRQRRSLSLQGIKHDDCRACWDDYDKGDSAYRDWANRWTEEYLESHQITDTDNHIYYIEIKPDRICDMSCIYCSSYSSSKIAKEEGIIYLDKTDESDYEVFKSWIKDFLNRKDLKNNQIIFIFLGGEPTASEKFYQLTDYIEYLAMLNPNLKIRLEICTNANSKSFLMDKIVNRMNVSKLNWAIGISNESYGETAELIRYGLNWKRFESNFGKYIQHPKTELIVLSPTVNIFSLKSFKPYVEWVFDQFKKYSPEKEFSWYGNFISWPDQMDISLLPKSYKKYIEETEAFLLEQSSNKKWLYQENFLDFICQMKNRISQNYDPEYKSNALEFLKKKQQIKKTDKLIKLMENLDL